LAKPELKAKDVLGRFELRKLLGQGAQSKVWLAFDPRMEREVAIKVMRTVPGSDEKAVTQWLQEARSVGRVKHPSIVPVYEADIQDNHPYLVFEYVPGLTLAQTLALKGPMPAREAVAVMMDVLDALAVAHLEGIIHRDIKPSNIVIDTTGRARVMDFGIAARVHAPGSVAVGGTVGYLSPEAIHGAQPVVSMDIFACGLVLAELLLGKPLMQEPDPNRAMYRVANEQLTLPDTMPDGVDEQLRAVIRRALALEPAMRYADVRRFFLALDTWAKPLEAFPDGGAATTSVAGGTLEFLLRRMRHKTDFPAMSDAVMRIQKMASSENESVGSVTNEILKDVALTNKLLKVVNSALYARGDTINTVSRAVTLVGFNGIRNMALSLVLLEHMQDKAHAARLKEEFLRSLLAGMIGGELCTSDSEEAFLGAMFQDLGRLLVQYYFPEEASQIRNLTHAAREPVSENVAAVRLLGITFEELGIGISKSWAMPQSMLRCMRKPAGNPPSSGVPDPIERIRWAALAANEIADVILHNDLQNAVPKVDHLGRKYLHAIGSNVKDLRQVTELACQKLADLAVAMEITVLPGTPAARLLGQPQGRRSVDSIPGSLDLQVAQKSLGASSPAAERSPKVAELLAAGIQDITNAMVEDFKLTDVLRMILETMFRALEFDRIIFCMRDSKTEILSGRFGLGQGVEAYAKVFRTELKAATPDLFGIICLKGADTMISDASEKHISQRLPLWYLKSLNAPAFLLLPLQIKGTPFGLIYADKITKGALELDEKELALLRTLRNQAVMAFKQAG
jgi:serine/threonine protein kinase